MSYCVETCLPYSGLNQMSIDLFLDLKKKNNSILVYLIFFFGINWPIYYNRKFGDKYLPTNIWSTNYTAHTFNVQIRCLEK